MDQYDSSELDLILDDIKQLLSEDAPPPAAKPLSQETRKFTPVHAPAPPPQEPAARAPWEEPDFAGTYYDGVSAPQVIRSASFRQAPPPQKPPASQRPAQPRQAQPRQPQPRQPERPARAVPTRAQKIARQSLVYDNEVDEDDVEEPAPRRRSPFRWVGRLLIILLVLGVLLVGGLYFLADQPTAAGITDARRSGVSTILFIGTDASSLRTDTLMLLSVDDANHTLSLVSIPRDTLVNGSYSVPKINGVYAVNNGGEVGMEMLLQRVRESIGFQPDGYVLVDLDGFVDLVDLMGGVEFDVPVDMHYHDPSQNLYIDLNAGEQELDGVQAMGLVRYRTGYAMADLDRVNVQRAFVSAAADQWLDAGVILKAPRLWGWVQDHVETDLSLRNLIWLAKAMMRADRAAITTETLPGTATTIQGGSYYVLDPYAVAEMVNRSLNPYVREITVDDLLIRN